MSSVCRCRDATSSPSLRAHKSTTGRLLSSGMRGLACVMCIIGEFGVTQYYSAIVSFHSPPMSPARYGNLTPSRGIWSRIWASWPMSEAYSPPSIVCGELEMEIDLATTGCTTSDPRGMYRGSDTSLAVFCWSIWLSSVRLFF